MSKRHGLVLAVMAVGVLAVTQVDAQRLDYRRHTWSGVSGFEGSTRPLVLTPVDAQRNDGTTVSFGRGMTGLWLYYGGDTALAAKLRFRHIGRRNSERLRRHSLWHQIGESQQLVFGTRTSSNFHYAGNNAEDLYVTGINVCTTRSGQTSSDNIRGFRLFFSRHMGGNNLERIGTSESDQWNGCERWHTRRNCPRGTIATGIRVHTAGALARGIELRCTELEGRN